MSAEHMLFPVVLFFIMLFIIATGYAYYSYKKHIQDYTIFCKNIAETACMLTVSVMSVRTLVLHSII